MPQQKCKTVYTFDELDTHAKDRARDWYRSCMESEDYSEYILTDAVEIAGMLGISIATRTARLMGGSTRQEPVIYWSGFSSQGDGACFAGSYNYRKGSVALVTAHAPQDKDLREIAIGLRDVQRRHFYKLQSSIAHTGRYSHEHSVTIETEHAEDSYRDLGADGDTVAELLRDYMRWIYRSLEREYEYQSADAQIDETIRANEYEFDEGGRRA